MELNSVINLSLSQAKSDRHSGIFLPQTQHVVPSRTEGLWFICANTHSAGLGNCKLPAQVSAAYTCPCSPNCLALTTGTKRDRAGSFLKEEILM